MAERCGGFGDSSYSTLYFVYTIDTPGDAVKELEVVHEEANVVLGPLLCCSSGVWCRERSSSGKGGQEGSNNNWGRSQHG